MPYRENLKAKIGNKGIYPYICSVFTTLLFLNEQQGIA